MFVKKGEVIQRKGELNTKIYRVKKGLLRSYALDQKGKEHIFMFAPEQWIIADSTGPEFASELFIDALEDSEVELIEKDHKHQPQLQKLYNRLGALQSRILLMLRANALERYEDFLQTYPDIVARVPNG